MTQLLTIQSFIIMKTRIIGIDFGTSTTVVRVHNVGAENRIVPLAINGQRTIPTIAFQTQDTSEMYYGYDAKAKYDSNVEGTLYNNFKMDLISDDDTKRNQAERLINGFLHYVYEQYQGLLNAGTFDPADEVKVYVSHPAKWNSYARTLMKQSVVNAGFCRADNIALKDEPTAAILSVIHEKNVKLKQAGLLFEGRKYKAMMVDMGAGTTDIVLCFYQVANGKLKIDNIFTYPSINTPGLCGGREIDDAIISKVERFVNEMQAKPSTSGKKVVNKLQRRVKNWKETTISGVLRDSTLVPEPDEITEFRDMLTEYGVPVVNGNKRFSFDRKDFETFTVEHWIQWVKLLKGAFDDVAESQYANLECPKRPEDVELMIITGGHSKWYIVPEYILGKQNYINLPSINFAQIQKQKYRLVQSVDPQETVAVGLCHLDEDVVGTMAASNNVAISFTCDGKFLGACDLIKKGVPLPYKKSNFKIENRIKGNFFFRKAFEIKYSIITDKTNTIKKSVTAPADGILMVLLRTVLAVFGVAIIDIPRFIYYFVRGKLEKLDSMVIDDIINNDYKVELAPEICVNEEGIIKVGGTITVDGDAKVTIPEIVI